MTKTQGYQFLLEEAREIRYAGRGISFIFFLQSNYRIMKALRRCQSQDGVALSSQEQVW